MLLLRWLGTIIDLVLLVAVLFLPDLVLGPKLYAATLLIWVGLILAYYPVGEGLWGRTVGKLVTGLVIVDEAGRPPGIPKALLRTLLRLIEVNPFLLGGIPAAIAVAASPRRQRLGDMAAQTFVVRRKALAAPSVDRIFE